MEIESIAEREDLKEDKNRLEIDFFTEARTDAIREALEFVAASCVNSSMNLIEIQHHFDEEGSKEYIVLDAEDVSAKFVQGLTQELIKSCDSEFELGSSQRSPDVLYIVADLPDELVSEDELQDDGVELRGG